ncbi:LPS-assembly protein [Fructobacillus pseudoficulneus]|uniref:LPS-assembly protein n=1 Tax=Fructobacillus pseudoficulneus TaxID=220714 RepID=A0A3F3GX04_9LACO|nr:hypothetical protein [Fructobacillus pseudoficulneus]GAP03206.1 LPS-assembly protein [Fructobacillus pseudoficulneus]
MADSQSLSVANSQAAASQVKMNVGATRSTSATQWAQSAVQSRKVVTRAASQNVNTNQQVAGSQSADLASQTQ